MKISQIMNIIDYKIISSTPYLWKCFGEDSRIFDFGHSEEEQRGSFIVNQYNEIMEIDYSVSENNSTKHFRWIHPDYLESFKKECEKYQVNFKNLYDDVDFFDIDLDIMCHQIKQEFDKKTEIIDMNISDHDFLLIAKAAHKENITIQDFIEQSLIEQINLQNKNKKRQMK